MNNFATNIKMIVSIILLLVFGCKETRLPPSVNLGNDILTFTLFSKSYSSVSLGSNIFGEWSLSPMQKRDSIWFFSVQNPKKNIEYKFFINDSYWIEDPLNSNKVQVPAPFKGFNSVIKLSK
jgi:hypothetical protein